MIENPHKAFKWKVTVSVDRFLKYMPRMSLVAEGGATNSNYQCIGRLRPTHHNLVFQYTLSGRGTFKDAHGDHELPKGSCFLCKVNDPEVSYGYPADGTEPWNFIFICLHGIDDVIHEMTQAYGHIYSLDENDPVLTWIRRFSKYNNSHVRISQAEATQRIYALLGELLKSIDKGLAAPRRSEEIVKSAEAMIMENEEGSLKVTELARRLGISREHLSKSFREVKGASPVQALAKEKVNRATSLLRNTNLSCGEIAASLGYQNAAHFTRMFKQNTGMNPLQFRKSGLAGL
jgi:AraC family transcriptional regulator, arabinose operon regulatory protein